MSAMPERTAMNTSVSPSFAEKLHSDHPAADRADKMGLYAFLIGRWEMDSVIHSADGKKQPGPKGEIHAGWVLEGRALQDVWILPGVFYGSTLRVYDPGLDAWHILWSDPVRQVYTRQIGRAKDKEIVQDGTDGAGTPLRWSFSDITANSFHWLGERSEDGGKTFRRQIEFFVRRV
jgi:hypothetical protein